MVEATDKGVAELLNELNKSDASRAMKRMVARDPESAGVERNSARQEVEKYIRSWEWDMSEEEPIGGSYFMALWNGDVNDAMLRADGTNSELMRKEFGITRDEALDNL